jgi:hypothetical protein
MFHTRIAAIISAVLIITGALFLGSGAASASASPARHHHHICSCPMLRGNQKCHCPISPGISGSVTPKGEFGPFHIQG